MKSMGFYHYGFDGEALGGEMIVLASNMDEADELARKMLKEEYPGLKDPAEELDLRFCWSTPWDGSSQVIHYWNGDY